MVDTHDEPRGENVDKRPRVLLIDDDPFVARGLSRLLSRNAHVLVAATAAAARERLGSDTFDLILCDMMLPDVTGLTLYREIERWQPAAAERFVFVTGGAEPTSAEGVYSDENPERVIFKPLTPRRARLLVDLVGEGHAVTAAVLASR